MPQVRARSLGANLGVEGKVPQQLPRKPPLTGSQANSLFLKDFAGISP